MARIFVAGTADTKAEELAFLAEVINARGGQAAIVDLSTRGPVTIDVAVTAAEVASCHPKGAGAVLGMQDRGQAVAAMGQAFTAYLSRQTDLAGVIGIGGGGGTSMITAAMRALPLGLPKIMVTTMASGDTAPYVGISDLILMPAITDLAGLNRISRVILHNAGGAIAGMAAVAAPTASDKPAIGLTMFGVTTPCVTAISAALRDSDDCLVFHATGTGGRSMEKLADSGLLSGMIDITTTEVADLLCGGVLACTEDRFGAVARSGLPWVGSLGACDMVNFGAPETVPAGFRGRLFYHHNPQVTLMRTTADENHRMGRWIAERLNLCHGPVRMLIPEGGISALDAPGQAFYDPAANDALFSAIEAGLTVTPNRQVIRLPHHINDPAFAKAAVAAFMSII